MAKPAEATLGNIALNRLSLVSARTSMFVLLVLVLQCLFVVEPFGVCDGPLSLHVERA